VRYSDRPSGGIARVTHERLFAGEAGEEPRAGSNEPGDRAWLKTSLRCNPYRTITESLIQLA